LTGWNPLLERTIVGRERIIVYTHRDLGTDSSESVEQTLRNYHRRAYNNESGKHRVVFWRKDDPVTTKKLLGQI
jgi:hypothetical protein